MNVVAIRPFKVGPGDKLRWLEAVAKSNASAFSLRIAVAISNRVNGDSGTATIDQEWLGLFAGCNGKSAERQARRATVQLEKLGLVRIDRSEAQLAKGKAWGGRGRANVYTPIIPGKRLETRTPRSGFDETGCTHDERLGPETRTKVGMNPDKIGMDAGQRSPPLPYVSNKSSSHAHRRGLCPNVADSDRADLLRNGQAEALADAQWKAISLRLRSTLGGPTESAWFAGASVILNGSNATVFVRTAFVRNYIEQHFDSHLLAACCDVFPAVDTVQIAVAE